MRISIKHRDEVLAIVQRRMRRVQQSAEVQELSLERSDPQTEALTARFCQMRRIEIMAAADVDQKRLDALKEHYNVTQGEIESID